MNKHESSINQYIFPFLKKSIGINLQSKKVTVASNSPFKSDEIEIDLHTVDSNSQKTRKFALFWFFSSVLTTLFLITFFSIWFWNPPKSIEYVGLYLFGQMSLLLGVFYSWWKFSVESYSLTIFFNKYTNTVAFTIYNNKPDQENYEQFSNLLKDTIQNCENSRNVQLILQNIPTHILVEEFSSSYLNELVKRGVDVEALLYFLQKRLTNWQQTIQ